MSRRSRPAIPQDSLRPQDVDVSQSFDRQTAGSPLCQEGKTPLPTFRFQHPVEIHIGRRSWTVEGLELKASVVDRAKEDQSG